MHPALLLLLRLRTKATIRRMLRAMRTPRGVVFTVIGAMLFAVWLGPVFLSALFRRDRGLDPEAALAYGPAVLAVICLLNAVARMGQGSLYFTPAEINFLFSAPVSRRQLLLYKMATVVAASAGLGVFFAIFFSGIAHWLITAMIGGFLAMLFVNLLSVAAAMVKENVTQPGSTFLRVIVLGVFATLALAFAVPLAMPSPDSSFGEAAQEVLTSPTVIAVLAPLRVFLLAITADSVAAFVLWALAGLMLNLLMFAAIVRLDALNLEAALHSSHRFHERIERARRGGSAVVWNRAARWRIAPLPRLGGAGPIIWRQLTSALRTSKGLFMVLAIGIAVIAAIAFFIDAEHYGAALAGSIGPSVFLTFFLVTMTRFDFRSDLDQLEWLKMLPISANALAAGQVLTPVLVLTAVQWTILMALAIGFGMVHIILLIAAFFVPLNVMLVGLENVLFLLYPVRQMTPSMGDLQAVGRNMVLFLVRLVVLAIWGGLGAGLGAAVMYLAGGSLAAFLITMWIVLAATSLAVVPATAMAFRRFDVSVHMPA